MQTSYRNKDQTSNNEKGQKRETKAEYDTGLGQFQSRNRVEMKYRPKDLSKVGIVYATGTKKCGVYGLTFERVAEGERGGGGGE